LRKYIAVRIVSIEKTIANVNRHQSCPMKYPGIDNNETTASSTNKSAMTDFPSGVPFF
jgi:hypothetical protein